MALPTQQQQLQHPRPPPISRIELNADMGESFGRWILADDAAIMPNIDVCNAAAGFHASDPTTLHATVRLAKRHGVAVGAHPGYPDLVGFGRRAMNLSPDEVADVVTYQVGAVHAFCRAEGVELSHVKPHGALYFALRDDRGLCEAAVGAVRPFGVPFYGLAGTLHEQVAEEMGVPFVPELFVDIEYDERGQLLPPSKSRRLTPAECAARVVRVARHNTNFAQRRPGEGGGEEGEGEGEGEGEVGMPESMRGRPFSVCCHSDMPGAVENVREVRRAIDALNAELFGGGKVVGGDGGR